MRLASHCIAEVLAYTETWLPSDKRRAARRAPQRRDDLFDINSSRQRGGLMNKALFLAVQLNVDEMASSRSLVELLNAHLVFAVDVAEAADALVQLASVRRLSSGVEASVEIPAVAVEELRQALETLSEYDQSWLLALEPSNALFDDISRVQRTLH
jgi:hypothetical protein